MNNQLIHYDPLNIIALLPNISPQPIDQKNIKYRQKRNPHAQINKLFNLNTDTDAVKSKSMLTTTLQMFRRSSVNKLGSKFLVNELSHYSIEKKAQQSQRSQQVSQHQQSMIKSLSKANLYGQQEEINKLKEQNKTLQEQVDNLQKIEQENCSQKDSLKTQLVQINQLQQQIKLTTEDPLFRLRLDLSTLETKLEIKHNQLIVCQESYDIISKENKKLKIQITQLQQKNPGHILSNINQQVESMKTSKLELQRILLCKFCNKQLKRSVTVIPCGHSYCSDCKKGYTNACYICGPDKPIEAVYLNMFVDEILKVYQYFQECYILFEKVQQLT